MANPKETQQEKGNEQPEEVMCPEEKRLRKLLNEENLRTKANLKRIEELDKAQNLALLEGMKVLLQLKESEDTNKRLRQEMLRTEVAYKKLKKSNEEDTATFLMRKKILEEAKKRRSQ